jgi:thiamine biosynthesis lipoprotein
VIGSLDRITAPATAIVDEAAVPLSRLVHRTQAMGGRLEIHLDAPDHGAAAAEREMRQVGARVRAWAAMLTRHDPASQLMRLNGNPRARSAVGPTLAAALSWALDAGDLTDGVVDASLLDERLRAEHESGSRSASAGLPFPAPPGNARRWDLSLGGRHRSGFIGRAPGVRLDLDGVAKGWLADRALARLRAPSALVDADGDIAVRVAPGKSWEIGIGDPRNDEVVLGILALPGGLLGARDYGVATSGTSVHRWGAAGEARHHLINPATGTPARSDVVQATVVAFSAREAEAYAKTIVILGAAVGLDLVERSDALGAVVLLDNGRTIALPRTSRFLA